MSKSLYLIVLSLVLGALPEVVEGQQIIDKRFVRGHDKKASAAMAAAGLQGDDDDDDQTAGEAEAKAEAEQDSAESRFLGFGFGLGVGLSVDMGDGDRVDEAILDENDIVRIKTMSNELPRLVLETHYFFESKQKYCVDAAGEIVCDDNDEPFKDTLPLAKWGHGPFVAIQSSQDEVLDAFALGWMVGLRRRTASQTSSNSLNFGIGVVFDQKVKTLGDGVVVNEPLPSGETEIRIKEESRMGILVVSSFTF